MAQPIYTNKLALAGMLITAEGRVEGKAVLESTAKKYVGVMSANDVVEKYGFYVADMTDSASSDKVFRKFGAPKTGEDANVIMTAIKNIIPAAGAAAAGAAADPNAATVAELDKYLSYSGTAKNAGRTMINIATVGYGSAGAKSAPLAVINFNAAIPNKGFAFWDKFNSTFQLFLEYNKVAAVAPATAETISGQGYLQFSGGRGLRNEQFKITDNVVQFSKGANVAIIKLIQDLVGASELTVVPAAVAGADDAVAGAAGGPDGAAGGPGGPVVPAAGGPGGAAGPADTGGPGGAAGPADTGAVTAADERLEPLPPHMLPSASHLYKEEPLYKSNPPYAGVSQGGKKTRRKRKSNKKKGGTRPRRQNKSTKKGRRSRPKKK